MKPIPQGPFLRGLIASNSIYAQPKGSVARISNLCYKKRGAMNTIDGSQIINWYNGEIQTNRGFFEGISLFQPINVARYFMVLANAPDLHLGAPTGLVASDGGAGGQLPISNTYYYVVTALDGLGGETPASNEVSFAIGGTSHIVNLTWNAVVNAVAYNVYRGNAGPGSEVLLASLTPGNLPTATNSYADSGLNTNGSFGFDFAQFTVPTAFRGVFTFSTTFPNPWVVGTRLLFSGSWVPSIFAGNHTISSLIVPGTSFTCNIPTGLPTGTVIDATSF